MTDEPTSPFRSLLASAAARLEALSERSSPSVAAQIRREVVAVKEASTLVEGEACSVCSGKLDTCGWCGGRGEL